LPAPAPVFFRGHPAARRYSCVDCRHRGKKSGGGRALVAAHISLLKFITAYDFNRLAVGAPNAGAPFTRLLLKGLHDKSLVLHMFTAPKFATVSQWTSNMAGAIGRVTPPFAGDKIANRSGDDPPKWGMARRHAASIIEPQLRSPARDKCRGGHGTLLSCWKETAGSFRKIKALRPLKNDRGATKRHGLRDFRRNAGGSMCEKCCCPYLVPPWWVTMGVPPQQYGVTAATVPAPPPPAAPSAPTHITTPAPPPPPPPAQTQQSGSGGSANGLGSVVSGLLNTVAAPISGLLGLL